MANLSQPQLGTSELIEELRLFAEPPDGETCPVARFHGALDGPWNTLIIYELLLRGPRRFGELMDRLEGISPKTLSARLKRFVILEVVTRTEHGGIPPKVVYELTEGGTELAPVLHAMGQWAREHLPSDAARPPHPRKTPRRLT